MNAYGVVMTTTTTGTGNLTLSAVTGYPTFANAFPLDLPFNYSVLDSDGKPLESGTGRLSASTTLVRDIPLATYTGGTYDDIEPSAVSLASGTKTVICTPTAASTFNAHSFAGCSVKSGTFSGIMSFHRARSNAALAMSPNFLLCDSYMAMVGGWVNSASLDVKTAASNAGARVRIGLYTTDTNGGCARLVAEFTANGGSPIDVSTTGVKVTTALTTPVFVAPGWYVAAMLLDVAGGSNPSLLQRTYFTSPSPISDGGLGFYRALTYGALPADETGSTWTVGGPTGFITMYGWRT